jgi:S-adenosylmethionine hydrolase
MEKGKAAALVGSNGLLEIAVRDGSAATELALRRGAPVLLRPAR